MTSIVVSGQLILGGSAVITALTGNSPCFCPDLYLCSCLLVYCMYSMVKAKLDRSQSGCLSVGLLHVMQWEPSSSRHWPTSGLLSILTVCRNEHLCSHLHHSLHSGRVQCYWRTQGEPCTEFVVQLDFAWSTDLMSRPTLFICAHRRNVHASTC